MNPCTYQYTQDRTFFLNLLNTYQTAQNLSKSQNIRMHTISFVVFFLLRLAVATLSCRCVASVGAHDKLTYYEYGNVIKILAHIANIFCIFNEHESMDAYTHTHSGVFFRLRYSSQPLCRWFCLEFAITAIKRTNIEEMKPTVQEKGTHSRLKEMNSTKLIKWHKDTLSSYSLVTWEMIIFINKLNYYGNEQIFFQHICYDT